MKKYLFIAATAIVALASCSDESFVGSNSPNVNDQDGTQAIVFNSGTSAITRTSFTGKDAATLLNNNFVFAGTKGTSPSTFVYDQYNANWVDNTANTTESNSNNWEYVGYTPATTTSLPAGATQTIKYWDYSTTQYDFAAYSLGGGSATATAIAAGNKSYTLTGSADDLKKCYISDLVTAYNQNSVSDYGKVVNFSFRSLAAKVRLAFFETVPGYSIKEVKFYNKAEFTPSTGAFGTTGTSSYVPTLLNATDAVTMPTGSGTMTITFPTTGFANSPNSSNATDYNKAHIAFAPTNSSDKSASMTFGTALADFATEREGVLDPSGNYLGRASNTATYAGGLDSETGQGQYFTVLPNEDPANLMIRIKYTLVATDGSGEEITVDNASAVIPAELAKWSPNYAYTYIFKISDMTNGSTGTDGSDNIVCGLTPITLNAVVVDSEDGLQETITTVSHPSITTYAGGKVVTDHNEYIASTPIYVIVNNGTENITLSASNAKLYTVTIQDEAFQGITEESVDNALRYGVISTTTNTDDTYTVTDANGKYLKVIDVTSSVPSYVKEIDAADSPTGNKIELDASNNKAAKFTPAASTIYAFQYQISAGTANSLSAVAVKTLTNGNKYYTTSDGLVYTEITSDGTQKVIKGGTVYYTKAVTYALVQSTSLTPAKTYYTGSDGTGSFEATGSEDPKTTNYYEEVVTYTVVPYATLTAGTTYYTSDRGAGAFTAVGTEAVDAEDKYYSGTLGTPAKYQYKIIKVQ